MECGKDQDIMILIPLPLSIKGAKGNTLVKLLSLKYAIIPKQISYFILVLISIYGPQMKFIVQRSA